MTDYRNTYAWHAALDLGPHLVRVAEQLPDDEAHGIGAELRRLAIDVPAAVAAQLVTADAMAIVVVLRAVAALEVIERVYPALDTAAARTSADALADRTSGPNFSEAIPAPANPDAEAEAAAEPSDQPAVPAEQTPVLAAPAPALTPAPTIIPISGDNVVHPDSPQ